MEHTSEQPDFSEAAGGLRVAADHLARCRNLPAVDGGAQLAQTLQTLLERIGALEQTMNRRFNEVDNKVDALDGKVNAVDRKVTVTNRNFMVRLENSIVVNGEMALAPLYSPRTGEEIPNCPPTLADLERLSAQEVAELLRQLDEQVPRAVERRRRQLQLAFGVRTRAL